MIFTNFELKRNSMLEKTEGMKLPKARKTGTTIAGLVFKVCCICNTVLLL